MTTVNGHANRLIGIADDAQRTAKAAVVAGVAYRLATIDEFDIRPDLFGDPPLRTLFIAMSVFRRQHPGADQAPASKLIRFIAGTPELSALLRRDEVAPTPDTLSPTDRLTLARASIAHKCRLGLPIPRYELRRLLALMASAGTEGR